MIDIWTNYEKEEQMKIQVQKEMRLREKRLRRAKNCFFAVFVLFGNRFCELLNVILFTLSPILIVLKLEEILTCSWALVLFPLYFMAFQLFIGPILFDVASTFFGIDGKEWQELGFVSSRIVKALFSPFFFDGIAQILLSQREDRIRTRTSVYCFTVSFFLSVVLATLKLSLETDAFIPWTVVFIPLYVFIFILFNFIVVFKGFSQLKQVEQWFFSFASLFIILFFILVGLKLDDANFPLNWWEVMSPLFAAEGIFVAGPTLLAVLGSFVRPIRRYFRHHTMGKSLGLCTFALISALVLSLPVSLQIVLAIELEGDDSVDHPRIFIPIFIFQGLYFLGCLGLHALNIHKLCLN
jgi:hypothetical protein